MLDALTALVQPWADVFADNSALATAVTASHVLAIFAAGGFAISADRRLLRTSVTSPSALREAVAELGTTHRVVITALAFAVTSGLLLFTSDIGTFGGSRVFWTKMTMVVLLLSNGIRMRRAEGRLLRATDADSIVIESAWRSLRRAAGFSLVAWFVIVLLGVILGSG